MQKTSIDYVTHTWNPIAMRCTKVSAGCDNCWHLSFARRHARNTTNFPPRVRGAYAGGPPVLREKELLAPLRLRKPEVIAVQFMGDLHHPSVPIDFIDQVFAVMTRCPQHTFLVLTKRPERRVEYLDSVVKQAAESAAGWGCGPGHWLARQGPGLCSADAYNPPPWPLPNVWQGTSVENQERLDELRPHIVACGAAVTFLSIEPMLGPMKMNFCLRDDDQVCSDRDPEEDSPVAGDRCPTGRHWVNLFRKNLLCIDGVILGGETGPGARPMHPDNVRSVRDQCIAADVRFFFKGWGEWAPYGPLLELFGQAKRFALVSLDGTWSESDDGPATRYLAGNEGCAAMAWIGKKRAGRILDGRTWDEMPERKMG